MLNNEGSLLENYKNVNKQKLKKKKKNLKPQFPQNTINISM